MTPAPSNLPPALCLMGPTASGKTRLAVELVQRFPCEIISVDSAQIYQGMDIGTGKPDAQTLAQAPHRLLDIRDPAQAYSAAEFRADALREMADISAAGKIPLLVGGTMLYFKVLREGMAQLPSADPRTRERILAMADSKGWPAVHQELARVDPESAQRIHPNDPQRLQRALEIYLVSGKTMTEFHRQEVSPALPFQLHFLAIFPEQRQQLHQDIAERFKGMLASGLVEEVESLRQRGDLDISMPSIRSVGYRQVWQYLDGECSYQEMTDKAVAATRQLAKRQITWLRSWDSLHCVDPQDPSLMALTLKSFRLSPI